MRHAKLPIAVLALLLLTTFSVADPVTYTYTGNNFNSFSGNYAAVGLSTSNYISVGLTFSNPLPANLSFPANPGFVAPLNPTSFWMSDQLTTITSSTPGVIFNNPGMGLGLALATDSNGNITQWQVIGYNAPGGNVSQFYDTAFVNGSFQDSIGDYTTGFSSASNMTDPGTWTTSNQPSPVPEPATLSLFGIGALAMGRQLKKRLWRVSR
jgi:hypothetical protein